jgi:hypothetical protein
VFVVGVIEAQLCFAALLRIPLQTATFTARLIDAGMTLRWGTAPFTASTQSITINLNPFGVANTQTIRTVSLDGVTALNYQVTITRTNDTIFQTNVWSGEGNALDSFCTGTSDGTASNVAYSPGVVGQAFRFRTFCFVASPAPMQS